MYNILELSSELTRLNTLLRYQILNSPQEKAFEAIVQIAATAFDVPVAAITFIDEHRQWIKASVGLNICETDRKNAVCNYTIQRNTINEVEDMRAEKQYQQLPVVLTKPYYRFYAGIPLTTDKSYNIGALCIMDTATRKLNEQEKELLIALSRITMTQIEISLKHKELNKIHEIQSRLLHLIHQHTTANAATTASQADNSLERTEDLMEMSELLQKQNDNIKSLLNDIINRKKMLLYEGEIL